MRWTILVLAIACGKPSEVPANGEGGTARTEQPDTEAPAENADPDTMPEATAPKTAQALYEECRDRVEGVQTPGECTSDADCVKAGCGSEMCVSAATAADVMSTCEHRECFDVLDTCACSSGECTWTVKNEIPEREPMRKLPQ